jgi:hypothetical protein
MVDKPEEKATAPPGKDMSRTTPTLSIVAFLLFASSAFADPVITRSRVKLSRKGDLTAKIDGRLTDADWGAVGAVAVRFGSEYEGRPLTEFTYSAKRRRYTFRDSAGGTLVKARFDLGKGKFRIQVRSHRAEDYGNPLELMLRTSAGWVFELPVTPEKRKSSFKGELAPIDDPSLFVSGKEHPGWKRTDCGGCHSLPVEGHIAAATTDCVACHGANGTPDPNRNVNGRPHRKTDRCTDCHEQQHGYHTPSSCTTCHHASKGLDEETYDGPPPPPFYLEWPSVEFTPTQFVQATLGIDTGERAVDFTLRDTAGNEHTLSGLLQEKPVLLILGAFT